MSRTIDDAPITTRAARDRLAPRNQIYWRGIGAGAALGYRKGKRGGAWQARIADPIAGGGYRQCALGQADDALKADGVKVLGYHQAEAKAREWVARRNRIAAGEEAEQATKRVPPATVAEVMASYLADYEARGGKAVASARLTVNAHIIPALGSVPVARLTRDQIKSWHRALTTKPPRLRTKAGEPLRHRNATTDPEAQRRRKSTANRILAVLKAALNHARAEGQVSCSDDAWRAVKAYRGADAAKIQYLTDAEQVRLVNACPASFRELVTAALLTGCRYGELAAIRASDVDRQSGTVVIPLSKSGKARHVALDNEGQRFFEQMTAGKPSMARLFERDAIAKQATRTAPAETKRVSWGHSDQFRFMQAACAAAKIEPAVSFHVLRHTYASRLARRGVPMGVIAAQLGHSDTRMTERHYAHLSPSHVASVVRQSLGPLGIVPGS